MEEKFITHSARETEEAGVRFASNLKVGDVVLLSGELGAGKTTFVQGIGKYLSVKSRIISPTFVLIRRHRAKLKTQNLKLKTTTKKLKTLYHIDLYRLNNPDEIKSLGLEDIFNDEDGIFLIEWGEKHENLKADWEVKFEVKGKDEREISIKNILSSPT